MGAGGEPDEGTRPERNARIAAFCVHLFTASGAACALMAMLAASNGAWVTMFGWLGAALFIDGVDGTLARRLQVAQRLPRWSGDALDFVIDYTTYVFVPAFALARSGLLPDLAAIPLCIGVAVSGALYFADRTMKIGEHYFRGFPALWNGLAFHLFVLKLSPWLAAAIVMAFIVLSFAPYRSVHPVRATHWRAVTFVVLAAWSALCAFALVRNLDPGFWPALALAICGLYLLFAGALMPHDKSPDA